MVLVLEDLHLSDPSTVEALGYIARRRGRAHLMILGTYRSTALAARQHPLCRRRADAEKQSERCADLAEFAT